MLPMATDDAYRVLDICEGVTPDEIKNAYRIMVVVLRVPGLPAGVFIAL